MLTCPPPCRHQRARLAAPVTAPLLSLWPPAPRSDYCEGLHDTLDLVVIGAWHGNGRKAVRGGAVRP